MPRGQMRRTFQVREATVRVPGRIETAARLASTRRQDLFDLADVVHVVTRVQADDVFHRLRPTVGMNPMVLPLFRREGLEQRQIHLAEHAEGRDGFARIALVVVPGGHQGVLIHRLDGGSRRHENRLDPRAYDDLDIGKMGEDLCDRPLSGRGAPAQLRWGCARDQALEVRGSLRLDGERILVTDMTQNALHVLLGGFLQWSDGRLGRWANGLSAQPPISPRRGQTKPGSTSSPSSWPSGGTIVSLPSGR